MKERFRFARAGVAQTRCRGHDRMAEVTPCDPPASRLRLLLGLFVSLTLGLGACPVQPRAAHAMVAPGPAASGQSAMPIAQWRQAADDARQLAENDAPRAYEDARKLEAFLPAEATAADHARSLNLLARTELYLAMTDEAAKHARRAYELATQNGDSIGRAEADLTVALNAINQGDFAEVIAAPQRALADLQGVDRPDLLSEAFLRNASAYRRIGKLEECVRVALNGMDVARRSNNPLALVYAHQALGMAFDQSFRYAEAREHFTQMVEQARLAHARLQEGYALGSLGGTIANLGDHAGGERMIRHSIDLYRSVGAPFAVAFGEQNLSYTLRQQGRYAEALALNNQAVAAYERHPNPIGLWYSLNFRSDNEVSLGQLAAARADVERAYKIAKEIGFSLYVSETARRLAAITAAGGDFQRAYDLTVEATNTRVATEREAISSRVLELAQRYEAEHRQRQIDELTRSNQRQQAEIQHRALQQRWTRTLAASTIIVLSVTLWFLVRLRRSHRALEIVNTRRQQAEEEVRALNTTLEQQVRDRTSQLEAANAELESFSYSVSHDLRAPLRGLDGFSRALLEDYDSSLDEQGRDYLRRIRSASQRMGHLIDDMLNLARVSRAELHRTPVDLTALAQSVADELRVSDPARDVEFVIAPDLRASGDPRLLQLLFQNLLHNAIKFTSTTTAARVECGQTQLDGVSAYYVRDNGVGFDMAYAHKLFGAFQRLHTNAEFPGTGIGLATVQRIVRRHGGRVWAESRPGHGATFYFTLSERAPSAAA